MANSVVEIIVKVTDGASKPLESVEKKLSNTGKAAKSASADMWQFNKTMFSTIAFAGLFTRAFSSLQSAIDIGAPLDKMTVQFERVLGPRGEFLKAFRETTNSVVDEFSLLENGLHLGQLGVTKSSKETAGVLAKMAVAARMAGKDTAEGVKDLTTAITDGNVAKLEEYGIMRKSNPMYMSMLATLNKAGGIYGATLVKQQQLALVMKALTEHTKNNMFMFMSTGEVVDAVNKKFKDAKQHIGTFLATALRPLLEKLIPFLDKLSDTLFYLYRNDKQIMFLTRSVLALTGALTGLFAALGTIKLAVKLLGFAGIGIPGLITAIVGLGLAFHGLTKDADGVLEKFRVIGAIFKGVYELVTNLDPETGMSKISKSTRDLLEKYGLLGFTKTIARIVAVIKTVLTDIYDVFTKVISVVNTVFGGMFDKFKDAIASFTSDWTTWWTSDAISPLEKFVRAATTILAPILAFFAFKGLKWGLGKLTGGLFGGGSGPKGTASDPIYTVNVGAGLGGMAGGLLDKVLPSGIGTKIKDWILSDLKKGNIFKAFEKVAGFIGGTARRWLAGNLVGLSMMFDLLKKSVGGAVLPALGRLVSLIAGSSITGALVNFGVRLASLGSSMVAFIGGPWGLLIAGVSALALYLVQNEKFMMGWMENMPTWLGGVAGSKENREKFEKFQTDEGALKMQYEHAKKMGWSKDETLEQYKSRVAKGSQKQTNIAVPTIPDDLAIAAKLTEQMQGMSKEKAAEMQSAMEKALASKESDGRFISPEEYSSLQDLFTKALDSSDNLSTLANKARENKINRTPNRAY